MFSCSGPASLNLFTVYFGFVIACYKVRFVAVSFFWPHVECMLKTVGCYGVPVIKSTTTTITALLTDNIQ